MIDFINEALSNIKVQCSNLYPIYIDDGIIYKHYIDFSNNLLKSIEDYYIFNNKYCLSIKSNYNYSLHFREQKRLPVITTIDYNKFLFYIEFLNIKANRAILIGITKDSSHLQINFYSQFDKGIKTINRGELFLISNMMNDGISIHLLNIFYEFIENDNFDQENPFCYIKIN